MAGKQDLTPATETYAGFLKLLKYGAIASALATIIVVLVIA